MSRRETLRFPVPPRDIRLTGTAGSAPTASQLSDAEQAGYERGLIEGERRLSEQLLRQRAELVELHHGTLTALGQAIPQVTRQAEDALVTLALEIARKLVAGVEISRDTVVAAIREALHEVEDATDLTVLLNPADLELLGSNLPPLPSIGPGHHVRLIASPEVSRGGCVVQTRFGTIDNRRETKLEQLSQVLTAS